MNATTRLLFALVLIVGSAGPALAGPTTTTTGGPTTTTGAPTTTTAGPTTTTGTPTTTTAGPTTTTTIPKVQVCHKGRRTLSIDDDAVAAHLEHGDSLGPCPD